MCDFDGTITLEDTAWALLQAFGPAGWQHWSDEYDAGRITDQESIIRGFESFTVPVPDVAAWALDFVQIRPGAREFFAWCHAIGLPVTIASNGLDCYILPILEAHGLAVDDVISARAVQQAAGIGVSYDHVWDAVYHDERDLKRLALRRMQATGRHVVYIGDGDPDFLAASVADRVFARRRLLARCREAGVSYTPFEDFREIQAALALLVPAGDAAQLPMPDVRQ